MKYSPTLFDWPVESDAAFPRTTRFVFVNDFTIGSLVRVFQLTMSQEVASAPVPPDAGARDDPVRVAGNPFNLKGDRS